MGGLNSEQDLASIPMAQGGLARLAVARLKSAGVPVAPLLRRAGLTPEMIAESETRLSVRSQITHLNEAAIALKDDCIGFTLARDHDPRKARRGGSAGFAYRHKTKAPASKSAEAGGHNAVTRGRVA